jgi:nicotinate-nucleotide adenylyltransferase
MTPAEPICERVGIYGGTFDPVHNGHLILAREAVEQLRLDRLIFVPAAVSPHKLAATPAPAQLRLAMLRAATGGEPRFEVDDSELRREPPSYAIDTVMEIRGRFRDAELFYLIGEDNLAELHTWRCIDELRLLVQFAVFSRGETGVVHPHPVVARRIDISATEVRQRVAIGLSIRYLVPEQVAKIIETNQLYREARA